MTIKSTVTVTSFLVVMSVIVAVAASTDNEVLPLLRRRHVQEESAATCTITGFSFYDSSSDMPVNVYTSTLDLTDFGSDKITIKANTEGTGCECVKISFAGKTKKDKAEPFYLYGDDAKKGTIKYKTPKGKDSEGPQMLEAWAYIEKKCKGDESSYLSRSYTIIPYDTPREITLDMDPFTIAYESTYGPVENEEDTNKAIEVTCEYFKSSLGYGFTYKSDISRKDFSCTGSAIDDGNSDSPLKIQYTISASFYKWSGFNPYVNRLLPTLEEMENFIFRIVNGGTGGPWMPSLVQQLQSILLETNVYSDVTALSLVE